MDQETGVHIMEERRAYSRTTESRIKGQMTKEGHSEGRNRTSEGQSKVSRDTEEEA